MTVTGSISVLPLRNLNMGMDLMGQWMKSTPKVVKEQVVKDTGYDDPNIHYNWSGWSFLCEFLQDNGMNMSEFAGGNDGELLSRDTCMEVADCIEKNLHKLEPTDQVWLKEHIIRWKWARNYRQY